MTFLDKTFSGDAGSMPKNYGIAISGSCYQLGQTFSGPFLGSSPFFEQPHVTARCALYTRDILI